MNTDYGFFQLFRALKSLRDNQNKSRFCEEPSEVEEVLPQINYWLLTSLPVHQQRYTNRARFGGSVLILGLRLAPHALIAIADRSGDSELDRRTIA
jgi:hypothetical protein